MTLALLNHSHAKVGFARRRVLDEGKNVFLFDARRAAGME